MLKHRQTTRSRCGVVSVEAAIILPVAFMFMFAIFDFGRAIATKQLLENATRTAARQAVVGTTTLTTADIQATVNSCMGALALSGMDVQIYEADPNTGANIGPWTKAQNGECIAVQVTGNYRPVVPHFSLLPSTLAMRAKALMDVEAN
jgi:Flp pilus assembly protein TadG